MRIYQLFCATLLAAILFGCEDEDLMLNKNKAQSFSGSFKLLTSDKIPRTVKVSGTSSLEISNGRFTSTTVVESLGYGYSAGRLEITENKITFIDTVFKAWPMHILPPKYLNGTYDYKFDGDKLEVGTKLESGWVELHTLKLK
jgi:hypothetical protein